MALAMHALLALAALLTGVQAAPNLNYPLMDQQPPVARIDEDFVFSLLPSTFNSTAGTISYTTSDMPSWLSFNSGSAAFYGKPSASDEGQQNVTITASDGTGTTSSWFNLIVTNYTSPAVHQGFLTQISNDTVGQLASVERLPGGTGISVPPYWSFSLGFLWETFRLSRTEPINGDLFFMARERGTTTLPSWLSFNNLTMTFGGVAPAEGTFTIVATGTDFWGYTGAQTSFIIQVGTGEGIELDKNSNFTDIVTMSREEVDYQVDVSKILVGGQAATADQVTLSLGDGEFSWLSIDR
jgi:axial budding pattern protein 2